MPRGEVGVGVEQRRLPATDDVLASSCSGWAPPFGATSWTDQDQPAPRNGGGRGGIRRSGHEHGAGPCGSAGRARGLPPEPSATSAAEGEPGLEIHLAAGGVQGISLPAAAAAAALAGGGPPVTRIGAGVAPAGIPTAPPFAPDVTRGGRRCSGERVGGQMKRDGCRHLRRVAPGMPPRALETAGEDVLELAGDGRAHWRRRQYGPIEVLDRGRRWPAGP